MFINTSYYDNTNLYQHTHNDIILISDRTLSYTPLSYTDYSENNRKYAMGQPILNDSEIKVLCLYGRYYNQSINNYPENITYGKNELYYNQQKNCNELYNFFWLNEQSIVIKTFDNSINDSSPYTELSASTINKLL